VTQGETRWGDTNRPSRRESNIGEDKAGAHKEGENITQRAEAEENNRQREQRTHRPKRGG